MSQKSFVFELQSFNDLQEVSQKSFVFELQTFNFESRGKASFLSLQASFLKEVSQKRKSPTCLNPKPVDNQITWISNHLTTIESQSSWQPKSFESHISWPPNHLNLKSFDIQTTWISNQLTSKPCESQINWQPNHWNRKLIDNHIWILNQLTTNITWIEISWQPRLNLESIDNIKSVEPHISWQPNHLNLRPTDNQITWIPNQLTTKIIWISNQMTAKSLEFQIRWQPTHLTLNSFGSDINWLSNQLNSTHRLPIGSLWLEISATASCVDQLCGVYCRLCTSHSKPTCTRSTWEGFRTNPWLKSQREGLGYKMQQTRKHVFFLGTPLAPVKTTLIHDDSSHQRQDSTVPFRKDISAQKPILYSSYSKYDIYISVDSKLKQEQVLQMKQAMNMKRLKGHDQVRKVRDRQVRGTPAWTICSDLFWMPGRCQDMFEKNSVQNKSIDKIGHKIDIICPNNFVIMIFFNLTVDLVQGQPLYSLWQRLARRWPAKPWASVVFNQRTTVYAVSQHFLKGELRLKTLWGNTTFCVNYNFTQVSVFLVFWSSKCLVTSLGWSRSNHLWIFSPTRKVSLSW